MEEWKGLKLKTKNKQKKKQKKKKKNKCRREKICLLLKELKSKAQKSNQNS